MVVGQRKFNVRLKFHVEATVSGSDPTKCQCSAFNLSDDSRNYIESLRGAAKVMFIEAGYGDQTKVLFGGNIFYVDSVRSGPDVVTTFHCQSGLAFIQDAHVEISDAATDLDIYNQVANSLAAFGLDRGSLSDLAKSRLASAAHSRPYSGSASASYFMDLITRRQGIRWSLNLQKLDVFMPSEFQDPQVVLLNSDTGLIGFPTKTREGAFKVRSLLNGDLVPGRKFRLESKELSTKGDMVVWKAIHEGDSLEGDYYTEIETAVPTFQPTLTATAQ